MKLYIKFSSLTKAQKDQVKSFYADELKEKKIVINQLSYLINPTNGNVIFRKDF